ncbi:MAG: hypothetical protein BGP10_17285 [Rhodanobacter sp. 68-29]|nr:hypothetical protein [Rhodanobacter sp.]ODU73507.1 MAG: hypothetical protein ABT17_11795 [Rhodanobacter sp. SCN 69-32]OJY55966.1 MAG: hypothetical protein BGP10_17285 [Rhodanobacter sp. 68-29]
MDSTTLYVIRSLPLRTQLHDTYRALFFPALVALAALLTWWLRIPLIVMTGMIVGMLPSLRLGTPSCMAIVADDHARIDAWLAARRHVRDDRGWVPQLPRALYFDSQIVRYESDTVVGPLLTLRKLRAMLQPSPSLPA